MGDKLVVCIVGPTGSGKSSLAQALCVSVGGEVVSADSMQVYRGMDIGTGKVPVSERVVAHHCLDLIDPGQPYSAALFQRDARAAIGGIEERGNIPVLCGGTGFYVRAAIDDYEFPDGEQVGNPVRDRYLEVFRSIGAHGLWEELQRVDPESASIIPENDVKRVVRAFELIADGTSYARQKEKLASIPQKLPAMIFGLRVTPAFLRERIDLRVDQMVEEGLVGEVENLLDQGFREGITAPQAIGYKEIVEHLEGRSTLDDALEQIKVATHRYAKRQRTWFNRDNRILWIYYDSMNSDAACELISDRLDTLAVND